MPDMAGVFVPFRLPAVADLDMVLQTGPKSRLKREETRCLNGSDSEPVKWTQVNNPFSAFTRGGLSSPNLQPNALACACLPIHLVAHISCQIAHLILSISVLSWKLVPGYLDDTLDNPTTLFYGPAIGETQTLGTGQTAPSQSHCHGLYVWDHSLAMQYEIKTTSSGPPRVGGRKQSSHLTNQSRIDALRYDGR